jgi:hypothetical protein
MERTLHNLDYIKKRKGRHGPFEITQLLNSFLGAFIHPKEAWIKRLPIGPPPESWPAIPTDQGCEEPTGCRDLVRLVRNGMAHGNYDLLPDRMNPSEIGGVRLWNINKAGERTWGTELTIVQVEALLRAFTSTMLELDRG